MKGIARTADGPTVQPKVGHWQNLNGECSKEIEHWRMYGIQKSATTKYYSCLRSTKPRRLSPIKSYIQVFITQHGALTSCSFALPSQFLHLPHFPEVDFLKIPRHMFQVYSLKTWTSAPAKPWITIHTCIWFLLPWAWWQWCGHTNLVHNSNTKWGGFASCGLIDPYCCRNRPYHHIHQRIHQHLIWDLLKSAYPHKPAGRPTLFKAIGSRPILMCVCRVLPNPSRLSSVTDKIFIGILGPLPDVETPVGRLPGESSSKDTKQLWVL